MAKSETNANSTTVPTPILRRDSTDVSLTGRASAKVADVVRLLHSACQVFAKSLRISCARIEAVLDVSSLSSVQTDGLEHFTQLRAQQPEGVPGNGDRQS